MIVAYDTASAAQTINGVSSLSWSHTASGADRCGFVCVGFGALPQADCSPTWNGTSMVLVDFALNTTDYGSGVIGKAQISRHLNPGASSQTVALSFTNTSGGGANSGSAGAAVSISYTGVHQTTPTGTPVKNTGSASFNNDSLTVTDSVSGDMVLDCLNTDGISGVPTGNKTSRLNTHISNYYGCAQDAAGGGSVAMDWTFGANKAFAHMAVAIKQAGGAVSSNKKIVWM